MDAQDKINELAKEIEILADWADMDFDLVEKDGCHVFINGGLVFSTQDATGPLQLRDFLVDLSHELNREIENRIGDEA